MPPEPTTTDAPASALPVAERRSRFAAPAPSAPAGHAAAPGPLARALMLGVRGYQLAVSPALHALGGPGCGCRFTPSCSHYALTALATHGALRGSALAARRLLRCHPWGASGPDPVPARAPRLFT